MVTRKGSSGKSDQKTVVATAEIVQNGVRTRPEMTPKWGRRASL